MRIKTDIVYMKWKIQYLPLLFICFILIACPEEEEFNTKPLEQLRFKPITYEMSKEEFDAKLVGFYNVTNFRFTNHDISISISFFGDSLKIHNYRENYDRYIYLNDTSLCDNNLIESIQFWNIYQKSDTLFLETYDLCGNSEKFIVETNNHSKTTEYFNVGYLINAEIKVKSINSKETTELKKFEIGLGGYVYNPNFETVKIIKFNMELSKYASGSAAYWLTNEILNYDCFNLPPTLTE